jgi:hypothetical protein
LWVGWFIIGVIILIYWGGLLFIGFWEWEGR